jgi:hypothetical protein
MATNKPIVIPFPLKGLNENFAATAQPALTSPLLKNVRPYDVQDKRARGGQRPGLAKLYVEKMGSGNSATGPYHIDALCHITTLVAPPADADLDY